MMELLGGVSITSPIIAAVLAALAMGMIWMSLAPAGQRRDVRERLDDYLHRGDIIADQELDTPLAQRALLPVVRSLLRGLGRLLPNRDAERVRQQLQLAGNPGGMTALDYYGLRILLIVVLVGVTLMYVLRAGVIREEGVLYALRFVGGALVVAVVIPYYWLRGRVRKRKSAITRAMPDCLDMLTVGVEAGLAFESAMVRVSERWDNEMTREFRRAVAEMRVGMSREEALSRMAERCGVGDLTTFVAVLVQSTQLGVSIAQVLHGQAEVMRKRRRQRAEELARQAGIKMLIPLVFFIFPALMVAILGPAVPGFLQLWGQISGR